MSVGSEVPVPNPRVVFTDFPDGSGVLLDLDTKFYFSLNRTGTAVWRALARKPAPADVNAIAEELAKAFDVDTETAATDVRALLDELVAEGLLLPARA